jgi:hypothetical protein
MKLRPYRGHEHGRDCIVITSGTMRPAITVAFWVLAWAATPARACPASQCTSPTAARQLPNLTPAPPPVAFDTTSPTPGLELWSALQRRFHDHLPHAATHGKLIEVAPTTVTGAYDTVPALGIDGHF